VRRLASIAAALCAVLTFAAPALADDICTLGGFGTSPGSGTLTKFSTATGTASSIAFAGASLGAPAIHPAGTKVYIPDATGNRLVVARGSDGAATGETIAVGDEPIKVLFSPSGARAYALNRASSTVSIIDVVTDRVLGSTAAPGAVDIALRPDGTTLYILTGDGTTAGIRVLATAGDGTTSAPLSLTDPPTSASHIAATNSTLVIADDTANRLGTVSVDGGPLTYSLALAALPTALTVSHDGATAYVATAAPAVVTMAIATQNLGSAVTASGAVGSLSSGPTGLVYAAETSRVRVYTSAGAATGTQLDVAVAAAAICTSTATVPSAPQAVTGTRGDSAMAVAWTAPAATGGAPITSYEVTASPGGATCTASDATTCTVTGLRNGTGYSFTVRARNVVGWGPASDRSAAIQPRRDTSAQPLAMSRVAVRTTRRAVIFSATVTTSGPGLIAQVAKVKSRRYCTMSRMVPAAGTYTVRCTTKAAGRKLVQARRTTFQVRTTFTPRIGPLASTRQDVSVARRR